MDKIEGHMGLTQVLVFATAQLDCQTKAQCVKCRHVFSEGNDVGDIVVNNRRLPELPLPKQRYERSYYVLG